MFPNSILGRPPFAPDHQQHNNFFTLSPALYSHQQLIDAQFNFQNADLSRAVSLQQLTYGNVSPIQTSASPLFRGRKRLSDEKNLPLDSKRQRFHSPHQEPTLINQIVPLSSERRYSMPPLFQTHYVPDVVRCAPPFREIPFLEPREITLPEAKDKVNQKTEARHILTLVHKHFCTRLSGYIERPQLIRAKVPIVKFRDKVSCVEFDLNVNNIVGIRNTFLLRTYAYLENRVRPLVLVIKKWASHHQINDASRGTLNSYSLVLMVLHYLQTLPEPILPSLQKIYPESFSPAIQLHLVHQAPCNVPPYLSNNESNLGELLLGFLKYYATEFDWNSQMISVREAKAIPRPDGIEWRNKYICVEEPFDGTNTARAVHEKQKFDMIKDQFIKSWHRLKNKRDLNSILPLRTAILKR
ncbi:PREDICTED: poly(A) RNA polymerase GLD2 [Propithecus coquereli]|uniref:polynucleotide adenylyltransferase n=1 Tax=Propithecus coquereli TaxID=379532 RepID=A0A2K6EF89_PROCO|nr:PREDICTED: poly(A) RNA polymerase GLD2 [Propithecus coquereli]